ncbi:hypothetical protein BJF79_30205 [Actinomadura sp. CNU-125]|uniref:bis-aminopropyl spermidine synthase family protein n=1 Tax=Actinomadura sp. CNU-125 TaxID=1904961 RepID=UPI0009668070|nr:bis-aminopropyl spermidine synthase family protein [Actinomadura sp. CNU-125]OLT37068.1 hypothetical protein BJF79_30205 [Actinomadura sp. CNU-125]
MIAGARRRRPWTAWTRCASTRRSPSSPAGGAPAPSWSAGRPRRAAGSRRCCATVPVERSGDRYRLAPTPELSALDAAHPSVPADPVGHLLPAHAPAVERLADLIARAPRGRRELDHVSATPETAVRRALFLGARFWLPGSHLLCVGDHDLTSLAVGLIHPHVRTTVVDIDDRVLAYIDAEARRLGLDVRTRWADLRLGLPPSARDADVAVTDPPYTPDGVGLFVARAVEGLRDPGRGRVLLAYGAGDLTPALALKVQNALSELNLLSEAIYPDFNRYFGAEAIGSAADLYVLRPTTKTLPAAVARADRFAAAIYTHGPQSIESAAASVPPRSTASRRTCSSAPGRTTSCRTSRGPGWRPGSASPTPRPFAAPRSRCRPGSNPRSSGCCSPPAPSTSGCSPPPVPPTRPRSPKPPRSSRPCTS